MCFWTVWYDFILFIATSGCHLTADQESSNLEQLQICPQCVSRTHSIGASTPRPVRLLDCISALLRAALMGAIAPILVTHAGVPGVDQGQGAYSDRAPQEDLPKCSSRGPV